MMNKQSTILTLNSGPSWLPTVFVLNFGQASLLVALLTCSTQIYPAFANSVDPEQLAPEEANWSGSAMFVIQYVKFYQKLGSSDLIGWILEVGLAS